MIAAKNFGYSFHSSRAGKVSVKVFDEEVKYKVLGVNEFNSDRKRMSIVVQKEGENHGILLVKGADNVILERSKDSVEYKHKLN